MKLILAALVAGLIGGGAVVGAVASGVVPMENFAPREAKLKTGTESNADIAALEEENASLRGKLEQQSKDLNEIGSTLKQTRNDLDAMNKKLADKASKADLEKAAASRTADAHSTAPATDGSSPAPVVAAPNSPEYRSAWRAEQEAYEKERQEQRKLNQQAERVKQLEEQKALVAKTIPETLASQAQRLNLNETQVKACSDALVAHATKRLELMSAIAEKRINDEDVEQEVIQQQLADLDAATKATLLGSVDEKTAESLLQMTNRTGRNNGGNTRGGRTGGQGGGRGN